MGEDFRVISKKTRMQAGRNADPSYSLIDSQSVKTTSASEERGIDGGKKIKGRKRYMVTDIMGNLSAMRVHENKTERVGNSAETVAGRTHLFMAE